jgi:hypothetical protein
VLETLDEFSVSCHCRSTASNATTQKHCPKDTLHRFSEYGGMPTSWTKTQLQDRGDKNFKIESTTKGSTSENSRNSRIICSSDLNIHYCVDMANIAGKITIFNNF